MISNPAVRYPVCATPSAGKITVAVSTLPRKDPSVETKRIFPAANHLLPLVS